MKRSDFRAIPLLLLVFPNVAAGHALLVMRGEVRIADSGITIAVQADAHTLDHFGWPADTGGVQRYSRWLADGLIALDRAGMPLRAEAGVDGDVVYVSMAVDPGAWPVSMQLLPPASRGGRILGRLVLTDGSPGQPDEVVILTTGGNAVRLDPGSAESQRDSKQRPCRADTSASIDDRASSAGAHAQRPIRDSSAGALAGGDSAFGGAMIRAGPGGIELCVRVPYTSIRSGLQIRSSTPNVLTCDERRRFAEELPRWFADHATVTVNCEPHRCSGGIVSVEIPPAQFAAPAWSQGPMNLWLAEIVLYLKIPTDAIHKAVITLPPDLTAASSLAVRFETPDGTIREGLVTAADPQILFSTDGTCGQLDIGRARWMQSSAPMPAGSQRE